MEKSEICGQKTASLEEKEKNDANLVNHQ